MQTLSKYFDKAISSNASDIHLVGGSKPYIRVDGELVEIEKKILADAELKRAINALLTAEQRKVFEDEWELDFAYSQDAVRFRVNLHFQKKNIGLAGRLIPSKIPTPDELGLNETIKAFAGNKNGLVLITGPTGSGKSTTIASLIQLINETRDSHIITVEDPVEFIFKDEKCLVEQREIGFDTHSFAHALKHVLRQDPDIIFVGEMRDPETIAIALTAAETGHLVFSTLHTPTAADSIERIVDVFSGDRQKQILIQLASVLRGVVAQRLYPKKGGGRIAAHEILVGTNAVANLIRENNIAQIKSAIQTGAKDGMMSLENSVKQLIKADLIADDVASK